MIYADEQLKVLTLAALWDGQMWIHVSEDQCPTDLWEPKICFSTGTCPSKGQDLQLPSHYPHQLQAQKKRSPHPFPCQFQLLTFHLSYHPLCCHLQSQSQSDQSRQRNNHTQQYHNPTGSCQSRDRQTHQCHLQNCPDVGCF
mmetsp:Transcript_50815/g.107841  ORF Transcript_50815/g.107841 Transcript_50815/m.107841 type:complete len:142 (-) Transcript_50815:270-695(-)